MLLWALIALALIGVAALLIVPRIRNAAHPETATATKAKLGGAFTLIDGKGQPFSSEKLAGKPYAIYFGFTRCGDICPTTLQRLARLRKEAGREDALNIVFVTIDPTHDGPAQVGQYATAFTAPIIGLTGTPAEIDAVKKQFGIYAEASPHSAPGEEMMHTATVLLFDRFGQLAGTITKDESDQSAVDSMKALTA